jgi:hypothetical protein
MESMTKSKLPKTASRSPEFGLGIDTHDGVTDNVAQFVLALQKVQRRLIAEGYRWQDDKQVPPER